MDTQINEIAINGEIYVKKSDAHALAPKRDGLKYVIARSTAGVFAGYLKEKAGKEVTIQDARRLWYWKGAASLSQLALEGVKYPNECKFPAAVSTIQLTDTIEILDVTHTAQKIIEAVPVWRA